MTLVQDLNFRWGGCGDYNDDCECVDDDNDDDECDECGDVGEDTAAADDDDVTAKDGEGVN